MGLVGNLGSERVIDAAMGEIVLCDAKFEDGRSGQITLTVGSDQDTLVNPGFTYLAFRIFFGNGGVGVYSPWIPFTKGLTIPCQSSQCRLSVQYSEAPIVPPSNIRVFASISEGAAPKKYSTLDLYDTSNFIIHADSSERISARSIPPFVRAATFVPSYEANYAIETFFFEPMINWTQDSCSQVFNRGKTARQIPVGGCHTIRITNLSPKTIRIKPIWHIEF